MYFVLQFKVEVGGKGCASGVYIYIFQNVFFAILHTSLPFMFIYCR